ncbi:MAG: zinc ribbon domain-containing protein [Clostridiales bacterium]|nr:zinc ribbon domain-containing protein [Clostridiales bacterium]
MKFCVNCGTRLDDDAKFCHSCGTAAVPTTTQPAAQPATEQVAAPAQPAPKKGVKGKMLGAREKTAKFEKKHSIIVNLLVLCCSFIVLMTSLFAPIKVSGYVGTVRLSGLSSNDRQLLYGDVSDGSADYVYMEVDQTIFDMIGALFYAFPGGSSADKIQAEVAKELLDASKEYNLWRRAHPYASEIDLREEYVKIYADHLSDVNYLGYLLAASAPFDEPETDDSDYLYGYETPSYSDLFIGTYISTLTSVVLGLAITVIAIVMAIMSLINLIKAIVGMCQKKTMVNFDKYMFRMLALSGSMLVLTWASPLLETGGGPFGISMFIAITLFVIGVLRSLFVRGDNWLGVIKRGTTALLCMLAFYLLCGNVFILRSYEPTTSFNVKPGFAFHDIFTLFNGLDVETSKINMAPHIVGVVLFVLTAGFIMSFAYAADSRAVCNVANGGKNNKPVHAIMIAAAALTLVGLIFGLLSGRISNMIARQNGFVDPIVIKWLMSGHVWASLVLTVLAIVLHFAFKPERIGKGKNMIVLPVMEAEPAPAEQQSHDAVSATEAPTEAVAEEPAEAVAEEPVAEQAPEQEDNA